MNLLNKSYLINYKILTMKSDENYSSNINIINTPKKRGRPPKNKQNNIIDDNVENINKKENKIKEIKVKKNIEIIKNPKQPIIKIKSDKKENKSMKDALEDKEVLLWGLNQIDSILLKPYEKDYLSNKNENSKKHNDEKKTIVIVKTKDKEFNPDSTYTAYDYDFLNKEYDRIDKELSQMVNLDKKYEKLLDLQDMISELIYDFESEAKKIAESENNNTSNLENDNVFNLENEQNLKDDLNNTSEINANSNKKTKRKLKPYYFIGEIPDGYREATQEEAIINKKVSQFGKYKVSRELYNIYDITGTLCVDGLNKKELGLKIFALKGKMRFYQKEYEFHKISINSGKLSPVQSACTKEKMENISQCYKKTYDVLNFYIKNFKKIDNDNNDNNDNKKTVQKSKSSKKTICDEHLLDDVDKPSNKKIKKEMIINNTEKKIKKNKSILNKN